MADAKIGETSERQLAEWMVGGLPPGLNKTPRHEQRPGLSVRDFSVQSDLRTEAVHGVTFIIDRGEILGIGGVDGNGQVELAEALSLVRPSTGVMEFAGGSPRIGFVPQDRQTDGLALTLSIEDNLMLGRPLPAIIRKSERSAFAKEAIAKYDVAAASAHEAAGALSGGNQQKIVMARVLESSPDLIVALNPTRGLDISATEFVHRKLLDARDGGAAIALFSTDLDELSALATRTLFMSAGRIFEADAAESFVGGGE